jgi:hypothetical protein
MPPVLSPATSVKNISAPRNSVTDDERRDWFGPPTTSCNAPIRPCRTSC